MPAVWDVTTPEAALEARLAGAVATLRQLTDADLTEAAELAWVAAAGAQTAGRVLAAANQALPRPSSALGALWQATTTLREHRGDGHIAALVAHGISPAASHLLKVGAGESEAEPLRLGRKFSDEAWAAETVLLRERGILDSSGGLTASGAALHEAVEAATDAAAAQPWEVLGEEGTTRLAELLGPLRAAVVASGMLPEINPIGLPLR
ncbi:hypothetical protein GCM10009836_50160 [Pseudonocardia ailaonensis]|uniref:Uncharacterized protein n=1 Tax=Pseudonocardia ailaonensis TaxID=367279 RepID=A0ABN2ND62_9PSEU